MTATRASIWEVDRLGPIEREAAGIVETEADRVLDRAVVIYTISTSSREPCLTEWSAYPRRSLRICRR